MSEHERGERGRQGEAGVPGRQGESGIAGREGGVGERGRTGATGDPGEEGRRGPEGDQPKLRWGPAVGYALLVVLMLVLVAWHLQDDLRLDRLEQRVTQLERHR